MIVSAANSEQCQTCSARKNSIFNYCTANELNNLSNTKVCQVIKKGQVVFMEGARPSGIYCINQGKIKITKLGNEGKEKIIRLAKPGDIVGYKSLITNGTFTATAIALEDSKLCFVQKADFLEILMNNHQFSSKFTELLCRNLSETEEDLVDMAYKSVRERLAEALLLIKSKFQEEGSKEDYEINITREDLANLVGTAKETVIRLLSEFKQEGIIESSGRKIIIKNEKSLLRLSNLYD